MDGKSELREKKKKRKYCIKNNIVSILTGFLKLFMPPPSALFSLCSL